MILGNRYCEGIIHDPPIRRAAAVLALPTASRLLDVVYTRVHVNEDMFNIASRPLNCSATFDHRGRNDVAVQIRNLALDDIRNDERIHCSRFEVDGKRVVSPRKENLEGEILRLRAWIPD